MSALDWKTAPLSGRLLVEASAGTGKTWTMAALYLRLLLDDVDARGALRPEQIVVATFTDAAAQELGARLRARLQQAEGWASDVGPAAASADPVAQWLAQRWAAHPDARERDRQRLVRALAEADRAPVGTLHSLCHRILRDYPLDAALGFAPLDLGDGRALHQRLARDLLRRIAHGDAPPSALKLPKGAGDAESLAKRIRLLLQPGATVSPPAEPDALRARVSEALRSAIEKLATRDGHYKRADARPLKAATALRGWLKGDDVVPDVAALVGVDGLSGSVLPPAEALIRDADFQREITVLADALQRLGGAERAFWSFWLPWLRGAQARHVAETGGLAFDQLVERVRKAVQREGSALPAALAARWPVVLVDEFQDTDAAQYALLDAWQRAAEPRGLLAIVGDPKQAIYRFRGGDIGVYRRAAREVDARLALAVNQRSHSRYVAALNHAFAGPRAVLSTREAIKASDDDRLRVEPIRVECVSAAGRADAHGLSVDGAPVTRPLVLHEWPDEDGVASNAMARPRALRACAELIVQLLQPGRATVGTRALAPGDIAVLLVSNAEVDALRRLLHRRGVPVVGQARQSVFATEAARDLRVALRAVLHPGDAGALRAALLLPLFGVTVDALPALEAAGGLDAFRERCIGWRAQWQREGVLAVVHALLREALPRLGRGADGERRLTDLRHLGELLQDEASTHPRPEGLLDWLGQQLDDDDAMAEGPNRLRLESDARRVRLITLHGSKGLEFPVVLLPTLWAHEHNNQQSGPMLASADASGQREALFEAAALKAARGEQQDERFRLLYVALTRAQQACHVFMLPPNRPSTADGKAPKVDPERSALDALLTRWPEAERGDAHPHVEWRRGWPVPSTLRAPRVDDGVALDAVEAPAPGPFALPGRYSFSWLTSGEPQAALEPRAADDEAGANGDAPGDGDAALDAAIDAINVRDANLAPLAALSKDEHDALEASLAALSMVRGPGFGNALHALLETPTPGRRYVDEPARVIDALRAQAVRRDDGGELDALVMPVAAMLDRAWTTPLPLPGAPVLGVLPPRARIAEMGFHFRLDGVDWAALRGIAARHGEPALIPPARDARLRGSMEGFVDLVFEFDGRAHVLDWKGNALPTLAAATGDGLRALMDAHQYRFQALLYTVALHRLLRQRHGARYAIARHLGAPVYVFLRAFGLAPTHAPTLGAWTQGFAPALVEAVDAHLAGARP